MLLDDGFGTVGIDPPISPLSDVTSSLTPTSNGELCIVPYQVNSYTWDMYFCNNGYCPTPSNSSTKCTGGQFGYFAFVAPRSISLPLKTGSEGINGTNQQCLTYYYYFPNITGAQHNINVRKEEVGSINEIIDTVTSNPVNGWTKRQVNFTTTAPGYKIYFDLEKKVGSVATSSVIAIDEISIRQGSCCTYEYTSNEYSLSINFLLVDQPVAQSTAATLLSSIDSTATDANILTSVSETSTEQITSTAKTEPSTTVISDP
ncbi:unnamed protein product [Rotaria sp. Silwood1]|nr:unnamed protein product [Rotaria sp. Silwood1]